jgi:uncharacterized HAD superfamily protein
MVKRPTIAVDIDDVLFDEHKSIRTFINQTYGLKLTPKDFAIEGPYWGFWGKVWGVDEETSRKWFDAYVKSGAKTKPTFVPGAIDSIGRLSEHHELVIISARDTPNHQATHVWLDKHFPNTFKSVEFVVAWYSDMKASKAAIAKEIGAAYLIDDCLSHCKDAADMGITTVLFGDYGHSRAYQGDHPLITRAYTWQEVEEFFDAERSR